MTSVGRMQCSNLTATSETMELITHFYACRGAALHQGYADVELTLWLTLTLSLTLTQRL